MARADVTSDRVRDVLHYEPATGIFTWRRSLGAARAGSRAGMIERGYRRIKVDGRFYFAHRLAWLYMTGRWPENLVDHRNGIGDDNRWGNLRECDAAQNAQNICAASACLSGLRGVGWHAASSKWRATIMHLGKHISLGMYHTKEEAHAAYVKAKAELHTFQPALRNG